MSDQDEFLRVAVKAVHAAADVVKQHAGKMEVRQKGPADLVTDADLASQEIVRRIVLGSFPEHAFSGRNNFRIVPIEPLPRRLGGVSLDRRSGRWHYQLCARRAALLHFAGLATWRRAAGRGGVRPGPGRVFTASRGRGAWLNGQPIRSSSVTELGDALAAVGFPTNVGPASPDLVMFLDMLPRRQAIRRTGCSASNLCYVAAGRFHLYWSYCTKSGTWRPARCWCRKLVVQLPHRLADHSNSRTGQFLAAGTPALHRRLCELRRSWQRLSTGRAPEPAHK